MNRVQFSEAAHGDVADIWVSIAKDSIDNADRFIEALHDRMRQLADQPLMGRERSEFGKKLRSFTHGQYLVIYRPAADGIEVARVIHGARDLRSLEIPEA